MHAERPLHRDVEQFTERVLEQLHLDGAVRLRHPDPVAEEAERLRRVPAPPEARDGRHARVVPAGHEPFGDEGAEVPLAQHRIGDVQARELDLARPVRHLDLLEVPVVERAVGLELEGAERVGNALDGVGLPVGPVVGRVDAPLVAGAVVVLATDPVHHRIAQVQVGRGHVDLRPQRARAVGELAFAHAAQEIEVLLGRAVAEGRGRSGRGQRAARSPHLVRALVVDEGLALAHELLRPLVEAGEVVGGVVLVPVPVEPEPADVRLDGVDVLLLFLGRVGVVHPQVAAALVVAGDAEVQADGLGVTDVEVPVRLGREAGDHFRMLCRGEILVDDLPDEVARSATLLDHWPSSE